MTQISSEGAWRSLEKLEASASSKLASTLNLFLRPVASCYECGIEVPALPRKRAINRDEIKHIALAGMFLNRTLSDLRAVWNLLLLGSTTQAGAVAATAFENALTAACVAVDPSKANILLGSMPGDSPWKVDELCKCYAKWSSEQDVKELGEDFNQEDFEFHWREWYASYQWLCRLKHPFMPSVLHAARSGSRSQPKELVAAVPDVRVNDVANKAAVLRSTILTALAAIMCFASMHDLDEQDVRVLSWNRRLESILPDIEQAMKPLEGKRLSVKVGDTRKSTEYLQLRQSALIKYSPS